MKKLSTTQRNLAIALALAAFGTAVTAPAFAGGWAAGPSSRNIRPYLRSSTNDSGHSGFGAYARIPAGNGYSAYAMVPTNSYDTVPTSFGRADRFGAGSQT
jgi:hypothetical protein